MRAIRSILSALVLALALAFGSLPAFATGGGGDRGSFGSFQASGFVGFGAFTTAGNAGATSNGALGGGTAESFGDSVAGTRFLRCDTCGGAEFTGFTQNSAGAITQGPGSNAWGNAAGQAVGAGAGGFIDLSGVRGTFGRR